MALAFVERERTKCPRGASLLLHIGEEFCCKFVCIVIRSDDAVQVVRLSLVFSVLCTSVCLNEPPLT